MAVDRGYIKILLFFRWEKLLKDSEAHKARLLRALEQFKKV